MKKTLIVTLFAAALVCSSLVLAGDKKMNPKKVPTGRTYVQLDAKGKELNRFKAGENTSLGTDCVQIKCPSTFEDDVTCWKCKESLKAN